MKDSSRALRRYALPCLGMVLAGCMATQGTVVTKEGEKDSSFKLPWGKTEAPAAAAATPAPSQVTQRTSVPAVSKTTVEVQCKTPAENYDFSTAVATRFGAEGEARLQRLMASNFTSASLTPKDREILKFMSTDMLWIPVPVEEQIGNALLLASSKQITQIDRESNEEIYAKTIAMVRDLAKTAPPNPFEIRLFLLKKGSPSSLAGGVIFLDSLTLNGVFDDGTPEAEEKGRFVIAHEMAHIHKRHRAKQIQQVMVDSDAGLTLMRQIIARGKAGPGTYSVEAVKGWIQTTTAIPKVAEDLMKKNEQYGRDQELEADACATAMMMNGNLGNPLRAFRGYAKDAEKIAKVNAGADAMIGSSIATHPPIPVRESNIETKMREMVAASAGASTPSASPSTSTTPPNTNKARPQPVRKSSATQ